MANNVLIVPIQLDLLHLSAPETVVSAKADFSKLPWSSGTADVNSDTPYLSEALLEIPLQNLNLTLSSGSHVHWTLPRALRTSPPGQENVAFPTAPNRWLITRTINQQSSSQQQWIVESDFMSDSTNANNSNAITVPIAQTNIDSSTKQPFMYLGRQLPLQEWLNESSAEKATYSYWHQVQGAAFTAMGYGELAFSTLYPNCRSVFGFFDHEGPTNSTYEILGWYQNPSDDILSGITSLDDLTSTLKWSASNQGDQSDTSCPSTSLFYGSISVGDTPASSNPPTIEQVAIGNTGTEALSAFLANTLSSDNKPAIEDQLEAILMGLSTAASPVDAGPNFEESRHERGFGSEDAGIQWTLRKIPLAGNQDTIGQQNVSPTADDIPSSISGLLATLNSAQETYQELSHVLEQASFQLYSDWYKYMLASYPALGDKDNFPDVDELRQYIERTSLTSVKQLSGVLGTLNMTTTPAQGSSDSIISLSASTVSSKAGAVVSAFNALKNALVSTNASSTSEGYQLEIGYIAAPRYYSPNDPVVLFAGNAASAPELEELSNDNLTCIANDSLTAAATGIPYSLQDISPLVTAASNASDYSSEAGEWRPQTLEWLVEFFPVGDGANVSDANGCYDSSYIGNNFPLDEDCFDFCQGAKEQKLACEYRGQTYVSSSASTRYENALEEYLLGLYPQLDENNFAQSLKNVWTLYPNESQDYSNPGYTAVKAYQALSNTFVLTQSLGGFHQSLLQHMSNMNIPVADPLGFSSYQSFTSSVASALQGAFTAAPNPNSLFMPIRAGALSLMELCLTDQFGRINQASVSNPITAQPFTIPSDPDRCWLSPRLAQAARLRFRWLAATTPPNGNALETNSDPATTPVCGWLMANYLDNSLVCYDNTGKGLGSFNELGQWQSIPGALNPISSDSLDSNNPSNLNPYLLKLLLYIQSTVEGNANYIKDLISAIQGAQANISPESYAGSSSISLLMGKPIAVVRAQLNIQVKGGLYEDQGWVAMRSSLQQGTPPTDDYEGVQFPIRLGEYKQLDDGLIGYFQEQGDGYQDDMFYVNDSIAASFDADTLSQSLAAKYAGESSAGESNTAISSFLSQQNGIVKRQDFANQFPNGGTVFDDLLSSGILTRLSAQDKNIDFYSDAGLMTQSLGGEANMVTMLMDPHGVVHATTGILPVKTIQIPYQYYSAALQNIEINFFTAPVLSPVSPLQLSLPATQGYQWYWLDQTSAGQWQRLPDVPTLSKSQFDTAWQSYVSSLPSSESATFLNLSGGSPWSELLQCQWLLSQTGSTELFTIVPKGNKKRQALSTWADYAQEINILIDSITTGVVPFNPIVDLDAQQVLHEGWAQLVPASSTSS